MRKRKHERNFETKMEMTPLIDCVFLLIMFFILTTQITVKIEDVTLPFSLEGKPQEPTDTQELSLIVNVPRDEKVTDPSSRAGKIVYDGERLTPDEFQKVLEKEVHFDALPRAQGGRGREYEEGPGGVQLSQLEILIRVDREVGSGALRAIFEKCQAVGIYKLKVATTQPGSEG